MVEIIEEQDLGQAKDSHIAKSNALISEAEYKQIREIVFKSFKKTTRTNCVYPGCKNKVDSNNHIIAENLIRHYEPKVDKLRLIEKDIYEVLFPPLDGRKLFKTLSITKEPTFRAFCKSCDHKLFSDVDNYRHREGFKIPDRVLIQMHYRIICNGLIQLEKKQTIVKAFLQYFEQKQWAPQIDLYTGFSSQIESSLGVHNEEKGRCERYLINNKTAPQMNSVFKLGDKLNPLCFGRLGYFAYQFSHSKQRVLSDFYGNMPYVTFSSVIGEMGESHIVFIALPEHADHLEVIDKMLEQPDSIDKLSLLIYIFSDGCILKKELLEMHKEIISEAINYFIENSGFSCSSSNLGNI